MVFRDNDSYADMARFLEALLKNNAGALGIANLPNGTPSVFYGDQQNIPVTPTACIDPGGKRRELNGAPRKTDVTLYNYIIVYRYELGSVSDQQEDADDLIEDIEALIHQDAFMSNSVLHSMVVGIDSGYLQRRNALYRSSRLTVEATVTKQLPSQF